MAEGWGLAGATNDVGLPTWAAGVGGGLWAHVIVRVAVGWWFVSR